MATRDRRNTEPGMRSTAQTDHAITIETAPMPAVDPRDAFLAGLAARESASQGSGQNAAFVEEDTDLDVATVPTDGLDDALPDLSDILMPHEEAERAGPGVSGVDTTLDLPAEDMLASSQEILAAHFSAEAETTPAQGNALPHEAIAEPVAHEDPSGLQAQDLIFGDTLNVDSDEADQLRAALMQARETDSDAFEAYKSEQPVARSAYAHMDTPGDTPAVEAAAEEDEASDQDFAELHTDEQPVLEASEAFAAPPADAPGSDEDAINALLLAYLDDAPQGPAPTTSAPDGGGTAPEKDGLQDLLASYLGESS